MSGLRPSILRLARTRALALRVSLVVLVCIAIVAAPALALAAPGGNGNGNGNGNNDRSPVAIIGGEANAYAGCSDRLDGSNSHANGGETIVKYEWDVDDNGTWDITSTSPESPVTFSDEGVCYVRLRVTNSKGRFSVDRRKFHVRRDRIDPVAILRMPSTALVDQTVTLDGSWSFDLLGSIKTYAWDFESDGTIDSVSTASSVTHAWSQAGTYYAKLIVTDRGGNTDSTTAKIVIQGTTNATPQPPTGLAAADKTGDEGGALQLTWTANPETDIAGYKIYRSTNAASGFALVTQATGTSFTDTGLTNGTIYYYKIAAVDTAAQESGSSAVVSATPIDDKAPVTPVGLTAADVPADQGDAILVRWTRSAEADLAGYRLAVTNVLTGVTQTIQIPAADISYTVSGLSVSKAYRFTLVAYDNAGNASAASAPVTATPLDQLAPAAPAGLVAFDRAGDEGQAVEVRWTANTEADLAGYTLFRAAVPAGVNPLDAAALAVPVASFGPSAVQWTDESVLFGTKYCYYLVASDASGNISPASECAIVEPLDNLAPSAPMGVEALDPSDQGGVVNVSWLGSLSSDVAGYSLTVLTANGVVVSTNDVGMATHFTASGLDVGVEYTFSVTAVDGADNVSPAASATASGLDELAPATPAGLIAADVVPDEGGAIVVSWDINSESDLGGYTLSMFDSLGAPAGTFDVGFATSKLFEGLDVGKE